MPTFTKNPFSSQISSLPPLPTNLGKSRASRSNSNLSFGYQFSNSNGKKVKKETAHDGLHPSSIWIRNSSTDHISCDTQNNNLNPLNIGRRRSKGRFYNSKIPCEFSTSSCNDNKSTFKKYSDGDCTTTSVSGGGNRNSSFDLFGSNNLPRATKNIPNYVNGKRPSSFSGNRSASPFSFVYGYGGKERTDLDRDYRSGCGSGFLTSRSGYTDTAGCRNNTQNKFTLSGAKSLSEGNLSASPTTTTAGGINVVNEKSRKSLYDDDDYQVRRHESPFTDFDDGEKMFKMSNGNFTRGGVSTSTEDMTVTSRQKSTTPKFFRSISLRNLLPIGGTNRSHSGISPGQGKRVSPPIIPPLVSFPSFRVKKTQNQVSIEDQSHRFSGGSLGSLGSYNYPSCTNSNSNSSSSNSSSNSDGVEADQEAFVVIGTNGHSHTNGFLKGFGGVHYHQPSSQDIYIRNSSSSFESFSPNHNYKSPITPTSDMHQGLYGKVGSPHVMVHVDASVSNSIANTSNPSGPAIILHNQQHNNVFSPSTSYSNANSSQNNTNINTNVPNNQYHTQVSLEDQGIDMTQSPGRESPSSTASSNNGSGNGSNGCRHSQSSFDSGRASSTIYQQGKYTGSSESSTGSVGGGFRHSYHSSSSSLGSIAPEEICNFDVKAMIAQGIPDHEVINAFLTGIHFEFYYQNFVNAGYDMTTIARMTPEDLNAIGITKPHHRKKLKSEISQIQIPDGLPDFIPESIEEWLSILKLDEYIPKLRQQGYHTVKQTLNITWEDLEDIGILKLGHQKKFMLAIKRIEDIFSGKRMSTSISSSSYLTSQDSYPHPHNHSRHGSTSSLRPSIYQSPSLQNRFFNSPQQQHQQQHHQQQSPQMWRQQQSTNSNNSNGIYASFPPQVQTLTHQPQLHNQNHQQNQQNIQHVPIIHENAQYNHAEVVSIHLKNGPKRKSTENMSAQEPIYGTSSFLPLKNQQQQQQQQQQSPTWTTQSAGKFDDGDRTPTNEQNTSTIVGNSFITSTLPRPLKNKTLHCNSMVNGVIENNSSGQQQPNGQQILSPQQQQLYSTYADGYKSLPRDIGRMSKAGKALLSNSNGGNYYNGALNGKMCPPPPPVRRGSVSGAQDILYQQQLFNNYSKAFNNSSNNSNQDSNHWTNLPLPPPPLSCDTQKFNGCPPSKSIDDLDLPPPPDDFIMNSPPPINNIQQQQHQQQSSTNSSTSTSSNTSPNNPVKLITTNSTVHYQNNYLNSNYQNKRASPQQQQRDFCESDLPNNPLISRGVKRNGSDASFKSNSSTESESIPFANDNAGTIKQQKSSRPSNAGTDVLNDIGNMLSDLTMELDAILEQEMQLKH